MKEIFAITTYCNSEDKLNALERTLENLKQYGFPIFLHAHYPLPLEIQNQVHSYFYSSDNPILPRYNLFWHFVDRYKLEIKSQDVTYTVLKAWNEAIKILNEYDRIHMVNYDSNIIPSVFELTRDKTKSIFFQNPDTSKLYTFMIYYCLNKSDFDYFRSNLALEKYLEFKTDGPFLPIPEEYITTVIIKNPNFKMIRVGEYDSESLIKYDVATTRFDWDTTLDRGDFKIFIGDHNNRAHILFFDIRKELKIVVTINHDIVIHRFTYETTMIDLHHSFKQLELLKINVNGIDIPQDLIKRFISLDTKIYPK